MPTVVSVLMLQYLQGSLQDRRSYASFNCVRGQFLLHHWNQVFRRPLQHLDPKDGPLQWQKPCLA